MGSDPSGGGWGYEGRTTKDGDDTGSRIQGLSGLPRGFTWRLPTSEGYSRMKECRGGHGGLRYNFGVSRTRRGGGDGTGGRDGRCGRDPGPTPSNRCYGGE